MSVRWSCVLVGVILAVFETARAEEPKWAAPTLRDSIVIRDGKTKQVVAWDNFIETLAKADAVFLGESHTDETTHSLELGVYKALLDAKQNRVVLGMEMFERDVQGALDDYLAGKIDEAEFLKASRPWTNYREGYRPLVEEARNRKAPMLATNFPTPIRRRMMMEGNGVLKKLPPEEQTFVPRKLLPETAEYWKRVDNATRGHQGMMPTKNSEEERLYSTQSLWDNSMGEACYDAIEEFPDYTILHVNGGFHSEHWDGTVHQLRARKPDAKITTVAIVPTANPATLELNREGTADFLVAVESRATNLDQGKRTVRIGGELEYRFHLPKTLTAGNRVPLLIWLPEEGLTAEEGMEYCRALFGDDVAIAVIEGPYKQIGEDLAVGRSWYWPETFSEDSFAVAYGVEQIWAYLLRHYRIDPERVCLAGEGTGATVVALASVHADKMDHSALVISPRQFVKLKDVPLPEFFSSDKPPQRSLTVVGDSGIEKWWGDELSEYASTDMQVNWKIANDIGTQLREVIGLPEVKKHKNGEPRYLVVNQDLPRARHWARLQSAWLSTPESPVAFVESLPVGKNRKVLTTLKPSSFEKPGVLPMCPGAFGGTTVLVLPENASDSDRQVWLELEKNDPLSKTSRFHRVRIAEQAGERSLDKVLAKLKSEKRTNVLIIPTEFFASPETMRSLREQVKPFDNEMTLNWLPGLGGRKGAL